MSKRKNPFSSSLCGFILSPSHVCPACRFLPEETIIHLNPGDYLSLEPTSDKGEISRKISSEIFWQSMFGTPNLTPGLNNSVLENARKKQANPME